MYDFRKTRITIKVNSSSLIYVYERNISVLHRNTILSLFDWHQSVESLDCITETQQEHEDVKLEKPVVNITGETKNWNKLN